MAGSLRHRAAAVVMAIALGGSLGASATASASAATTPQSPYAAATTPLSPYAAANTPLSPYAAASTPLSPDAAASTPLSPYAAAGTPLCPYAAAGTPLSPYAAARLQWLHSACLSSATEGRAWDRAAADLHRSHPLTGAGRRTIARLRALARLPDAMDTPQQKRDALADTTEIDHFFHTRLYLKGGPNPC